MFSPWQTSLRLKDFFPDLLKKIARELREGVIDADPCFSSESDNACVYCEFASACTRTPPALPGAEACTGPRPPRR